MSKHRRRQRRLMFYHDGRPQTVTRQGALKKSLLCVQEWPEYEVLDGRSDQETDRLIMRHCPTGEVAILTVYFEKADSDAMLLGS